MVHRTNTTAKLHCSAECIHKIIIIYLSTRVQVVINAGVREHWLAIHQLNPNPTLVQPECVSGAH